MELEHEQRLDTGATGAASALIHGWRPWTRSTGPKTEEGKARCARNSGKHGMRSRAALDELRGLRALIRECRDLAQEV